MTPRLLARAAYLAARGLTAVTDAVPPHLRFGRWRQMLTLLAPREAVAVVPRPAGERTTSAHAARARLTTRADLRCALIAGALDNGGVEMVVSALARGLPAHGVDVEVICTVGGRVAQELERAGVTVAEVGPERLAEHLSATRPDVIQLHRAERALIEAVDGCAAPVAPVFHAMESYLDGKTWASLRHLAAQAPFCVAVSGSVQRYFAAQLGATPIHVVVNGVAQNGLARVDRNQARRVVGSAAGVDVRADDILVVALQRYSDQKNPAGLVDAFLRAAEREPRLRLVVAGAPDSWLEYRRADMLRRAHARGDRVSLLGDCDPSPVLSAGDVFALDSFAEGGPIAAVEAVALGLPVVISDVGFARELVASTGGRGVVVPVAAPGTSPAAMARQRVRRHQANREAFARGLLTAAGLGLATVSGAPHPFAEADMVSRHAELLRQAAARGGERRPEWSAGSPG
ncbi:glycosyltransferase [Xylanimonas ulmi]|uniref:Glycosyltransferase involved in cell wall biosynthesis n=1 Tax=Xylanimonas ulmi TaxID=228973 RepID=A0A4V2EY60_9MICO|nr:glycosyltransferase [Xylanibacterium ulmi]RZS61860.1 glycosyltransferase involved in cell wall biosynthesis [Xylanibacterium ulmi]